MKSIHKFHKIHILPVVMLKDVIHQDKITYKFIIILEDTMCNF